MKKISKIISNIKGKIKFNYFTNEGKDYANISRINENEDVLELEEDDSFKINLHKKHDNNCDYLDAYIEKEDILYPYIDELLGESGVVVIDDESKEELYSKYVVFIRDYNEGIILKFVDNTANKNFNIVVSKKDIGKLTMSDIKLRNKVINLFNKLKKSLVERKDLDEIKENNKILKLEK